MQEVLKQAIEKYGPDMQKIVAVEECSELVKEICKHKRGFDNKLHIAEEIADIEIMMGQLEIMYGECKVLAGINNLTVTKTAEMITYLQVVILESLNGLRIANDGVRVQVAEVRCGIRFLKEQFNIKELVGVYKDKKIQRLKERLTQ